MSKSANVQKHKNTKVLDNENRTKRVSTKLTPAMLYDLKVRCAKQEVTVEAFIRDMIEAGLYQR